MRLLPCLLVLLSVTVSSAGSDIATDPVSLNVVPRPVSVRSTTGTFVLTNRTRIFATDSESRRIARFFADYVLEQHGMRLQFASGKSPGQDVISFSQDASRELPAEGYRLSIKPNTIRVVGRSAGLFYGMQTLTQLLPLGPQKSVELPDVEIIDHPRFPYRGVLLDVGRHFFSVTYVKRLLDFLAQNKINTFQWHLTDDEGWRIEIKKYPKLTDIGSHPTQFMTGEEAQSYPTDSPPYGGYYTQDQIREVVEYARARFITIVPEIEMPGHSGAALAAYPELACSFTKSGSNGASETRGHIFCPKPETFSFLENVLTEVISLFPGRYIHIGSDEVPRDEWRQSREAQEIIRREGLKSEDELQSFFVRHMEKFLNSKGKRMIGWDEILEGGLAPNAVVMSWRGQNGGIAAARQGHQVIMSPTDYCYLDYNQGNARREPPSIGGYLPLEKVYRYDPVPKELAPAEQGYILGVQGNVWGEYISTPSHLEYMLFPRLFAISEVGWSPLELKNYEDFRRRLAYQLGRLERQGVNYRIPEPDGLKDFYTAIQDHVTVSLHPVSPGSQLFYTLDGRMPTEKSSRYQSPFDMPLSENQSRALNLLVVSPAGRRSVVYDANFLRRPYLPSTAREASQPGLSYTLFDGIFTSAKNLDGGVQAATGTTSSFDLRQFGRQQHYGVDFVGLLRVPADGFYEFAVESDDGAVLQLDNEVVIDNDGNHGAELVSGHIPLREGFHKIELRYFQSIGGSTLGVTWGLTGAELQPVGPDALFH